MMLGEHADASSLPVNYRKTPLNIPLKRKLSIPIDFPSWTLNHLSVRTFNALYYWNGKRKPKHQLIDWDSYFYPLDSILGWNKLYGRSGFAQYQCVIPFAVSIQALSELLEAINNAAVGSFLAVLKRFGLQDTRFSFPMEGYTLALDFPINVKTLALMKQLTALLLNMVGASTSLKTVACRAVFQKSDQRIDEYKQYRKGTGAVLIQIRQSKRLGL